MKKITLSIASLIVILSLVYIFDGVKKVSEVEASGIMGPSFLTASSTAFTLTTTSLRLLGTTTPQGQSGARVTATIQPINCTGTGGGGAFVRLGGDVVATAGTGLFAFASSTLILGDHVNQVPVVRGSVQGIVASGTCTVLVTEWRLQ